MLEIIPITPGTVPIGLTAKRTLKALSCFVSVVSVFWGWQIVTTLHGKGRSRMSAAASLLH